MTLGVDGRIEVSGRGVASSYCAHLLESLGFPVHCSDGHEDPSEAALWAACGAMYLSGEPSGPPLAAPANIASCCDGAVRALSILAQRNLSVTSEGQEMPSMDERRRTTLKGRASEAPDGAISSKLGDQAGDPARPERSGLNGAALLGEKAALLGLHRRGSIAPGGSCRLIRAGDGWIALNLAREDDVELLPAWLGEQHAASSLSEAWAFVRRTVSTRPVANLLERGRLLGLPLAAAGSGPRLTPPWHRITASGPPCCASREAASGYDTERLRVVDLSSLWAGPLCTHLLHLCGANVVKVESSFRPDGTRHGDARFFDLLNGGKRSVVLDFGSRQGIRDLCALIESADIVVESSRPRALQQLGIDARALVENVPGLVWLSITGYGRALPQAHWVAFGDDAAAAAGLAQAMTPAREAPLFCGDAIADPLAAMHAALAALSFHLRGR